MVQSLLGEDRHGGDGQGGALQVANVGHAQQVGDEGEVAVAEACGWVGRWVGECVRMGGYAWRGVQG